MIINYNKNLNCAPKPQETNVTKLDLTSPDPETLFNDSLSINTS